MILYPMHIMTVYMTCQRALVLGTRYWYANCTSIGTGGTTMTKYVPHPYPHLFNKCFPIKTSHAVQSFHLYL